MSARTKPPFRADHVGSLLRPPEGPRGPRGARRRDIDAAELQEIEDAAIRDVVRGRRRSASSRPPTASSAGSPGTWTSSTRSAASRKVQDEHDPRPLPQRRGRASIHAAGAARHAAGRARARRSSATTSRSCATRSSTATPKLTIPSPSMVHYRGGRSAIDASVYPDLDAVLGRPDRRLRRRGPRGWPSSAAPTCSSTTRASPTSTIPRQREHDRRDRRRPRAPARARTSRNINARARRPAGRDDDHHAHVPRQLPVDRGRPPGGYDFVAEALFNQLEVDGFFLEFDDERSGGFEPLRFVPKGKSVVLGLVTTKRRRARVQGRRSSAASTRPSKYVDARPALPVAAVRLLLDASRATTLTFDEQFAKLELVVETAARGLGRVTPAAPEHPVPSDRARELVRGGSTRTCTSRRTSSTRRITTSSWRARFARARAGRASG